VTRSSSCMWGQLRRAGAGRSHGAARMVRVETPDQGLLDLVLPGTDGIAMLGGVRRLLIGRWSSSPAAAAARPSRRPLRQAPPTTSSSPSRRRRSQAGWGAASSRRPARVFHSGRTGDPPRGAKGYGGRPALAQRGRRFQRHLPSLCCMFASIRIRILRLRPRSATFAWTWYGQHSGHAEVPGLRRRRCVRSIGCRVQRLTGPGCRRRSHARLTKFLIRSGRFHFRIEQLLPSLLADVNHPRIRTECLR